MISIDEILSGNNIANKCDYIFSQSKSNNGVPQVFISDRFPKLRGGELIFCKTDYIELFSDVVNRFVPKDIPFSLVTHDSDFPVTDAMVSLFDNRPVQWWGMNCETRKANPIPIGIANSYCPITLKGRDFEQSVSPNKLLYVNHRIQTNPVVRGWLYDHFSRYTWCTVRHPYQSNAIKNYKQELLDHKFVLCPRGNGIDTHRLWEALYCGVIPVVQRHYTHSFMENKLPVLFVDDYRDITEELLVSSYENFQNIKWNMDMLSCSWWIDLIKKESHD
jgi:hypothetical protein